MSHERSPTAVTHVLSNDDCPRVVIGRKRRTPDVALLLPTLGWRGANRVMLTLANGFSARGLQVDMIVASSHGELLDEVSPGIRVVELGSRGMMAGLPRLWQYLRSERPPVLLTAMDYVNVLSVMTRALMCSRTRLVLSSHTSLRISAAHSPWLRDRLLPWAVRLTYRWADGIVAVSNGVADSLSEVARIPRSEIRVIYNPVISDDFSKRRSEPLSHPWFTGKQCPVILAAGSLTATKDFFTLLKAFKEVRRFARAKLVILGEGDQRKDLEDFAASLEVADHVAMPGFVPNPLPYMAAASVFVLSSRWEGFALVVAEALACGCPVVSTDCPSGPSEILEGGKYGRLVPVRNADAMASAILETFAQPTDREMLEKRGMAFTLDRAIGQYLEILGLVGNSKL